MDINEWVERTPLSSPIAGVAVLLVGRDRVSPTRAIGSGVFVADRLIMTVKHVIKGYWDLYGNPSVILERLGKKMGKFEVFAVQAPGDSAATALWAARTVSLCPYSDLALISVVPVDELAKAQKVVRVPIMSILPPVKGEKIAAFGYASTQTVKEEAEQVAFGLNPRTSQGLVTDVFPEARDSASLSFPSFEMQTHFIGGMSGGPIFNQAGALCGLICSGFDHTPVAYGVVLWPIMGIGIDHNIPGLVPEGPYTLQEMTEWGLIKVIGLESVSDYVETFEHNGKDRIRLTKPQAR